MMLIRGHFWKKWKRFPSTPIFVTPTPKKAPLAERLHKVQKPLQLRNEFARVPSATG